MKALKVSFDFTDSPKVLELLRTYAATSGKSQKAILIEALEGYFSEKLETRLLWAAAEKTFAEWNNEDDEIYNSL
jgi:hypothetical protein